MSRHRDIRNLDVAGKSNRSLFLNMQAQRSSAELEDDALSDGGDELTEEQEGMYLTIGH